MNNNSSTFHDKQRYNPLPIPTFGYQETQQAAVLQRITSDFFFNQSPQQVQQP